MRRSSGTFDKAGSDAGLPRLRDADHSRKGRGGFLRGKRGVLSGLGVMFGFAHAKDGKGEKKDWVLGLGDDFDSGADRNEIVELDHFGVT